MSYILEIKLCHDLIFGRGDGVIGAEDTGVDSDPETGLPWLRGAKVMGWLVESCAELLGTVTDETYQRLRPIACQLFGEPGSHEESAGSLQLGLGTYPPELVEAIRIDVLRGSLTVREVYEASTVLLTQTASDPETGAPQRKSLRMVRAVPRGTTFYLPISFATLPSQSHLDLLIACAAGVRRAGLRRSRRGELCLTLRQKGSVLSPMPLEEIS